MLEMNARSLQQKLESERDVKQRLLEEVHRILLLNNSTFLCKSFMFVYIFCIFKVHVTL